MKSKSAREVFGGEVEAREWRRRWYVFSGEKAILEACDQETATTTAIAINCWIAGDHEKLDQIARLLQTKKQRSPWYDG